MTASSLEVMLSFLSKDALPGFYCLQFYLQQVNSMPRVAFAVQFGPLAICTMKQCPTSFVAFDLIWTESITPYSSELILLIL